jgi:methanogenic corrinoid protein MtbC1
MVVAGQSAEAFSCHDWEDARPRSRRALREASPVALARLTRTIESEVIPRLMLSHGDPAADAVRGELDRQDVPIGPDETREFARLILDHDVGVAASYVEVLRARGASLESVFLYLLAPSARLLGDLWKEDLCSFADVTVGLSRLQLLLRRLGTERADIAKSSQGHSILLAAAPGEQHTFGILMVEESFRQAGWDVCGVGAAPVGEILQLVRRDSFDVIGFSASNDILSDQVGSAIHEIRRVSRNRNIRVLFGGRAVVERPESVIAIGADATATDGRQAALMLPRLIGERAGQRS